MSKSTRKSSASVKPSKKPRTPKQKLAVFCRRYARLEDMPVVHRHAAGIDLGGGSSHFVAIQVGEQEEEVREFGCTTPDLETLGHYLLAHRVTTVALEATGVFWMPVYDLLEAMGFEVYLVNPAHVKNVPGRQKDDKLDCRWLRKLHKYGLLSASFRPDDSIRPLRSLWRQRVSKVQQAADEIRHMQKALDVMNIRLHSVISELMGVTGRRILEAILAGERDPAQLAALRDPRIQCPEEELLKALTGYYQAHQIVALRQAYDLYQFLLQQIAALDREIEAYLTGLIPLADDEIATLVAASPHELPIGTHAPSFNVAAFVELLTGQDPTCLPGIGPVKAVGLLAELGRDMTKWPTDRHFGMYLTLAPQPKISGGKVLKHRTRPGDHPAAVIFRQAAASVARSETALGAFYRRLAARIGKAKALTATAYKIARMYYHLMREGRAYIDQGAEQYEAQHHAREIAALERRAKRLGLVITPAA